MRPTKVVIAGAEWAIKWVPYLPDGEDGMTTDSDRTIKIKAEKDANESFLRQLLVHEAIHACAFTAGGHWPTEEEHAVRLLERPLTSLFEDKRNAKFVAYLMGE